MSGNNDHNGDLKDALIQSARKIIYVKGFIAFTGRKFSARYGFEQVEATLHEPTDQHVLRLKFTGNN